MKGARFNNLAGSLRQVLAGLPDRRTGKNLSYDMEDFGMSAFSVFFTQSPSFLAHQRAMQGARRQNNAQSFFHIAKIPRDNQIRATPWTPSRPRLSIRCMTTSTTLRARTGF